MSDRWQLPVRRIEDGLLVDSEGDGWAYFTVPTRPLAYRSVAQIRARAAEVATALAGLRDVEAHLHIVPQPIPVERWARQLHESVRVPEPGWSEYLDLLVEHQAGRAQVRRRVFLGIRLGRRTDWRDGLRQLHDALGLGDAAEDVGLERHREKVDSFARRLAAGGLQAEPADAAELQWLVQRSLWRGIGEPDATPRRDWGPGQIRRLAEGSLEERRWGLTVSQPAGSSELAWLAVARLPDELPVPGAEWLYRYTLLPFPVEVSMRLQVVPPHQARRDVARKLADASDQAQHTSEAGIVPPLDVLEAQETARQLQHDLSSERATLVYSWPRMCVWAPDAERLEDRVVQLIELYRDHGVDLVRPAGDQLPLTLEAVPGGRVQVSDYAQQTNTLAVAAGGPTHTAGVGDGTGPYIGTTTADAALPVHFDPLSLASRNQGAVVAICGRSGAGKTTAAYLMGYQAAIRGVPVLLIDPKREASQLTEVPGVDSIRTMELDGTGQPGVLDPFSLQEDPGEARQLAVDTLGQLLPRPPDNEEEAALVQAADLATASGEGTPGLSRVLDELPNVDDSEVGARLATALSHYRQLPLAGLCFAPRRETQSVISLQRGMTIVQFHNIDPPDPDTPRSELKVSQRLAGVLLHLVGHLCRRLADQDRRPKMLILDEAWALTTTAHGKALVNRIARMGRSKHTSMLLISQNASDLHQPGIQSGISAVLAFQQHQPESEIDATCRLLHIDSDYRQTVTRLQNGECLLRDLDGRVGRVSIDLVDDRLAAAFQTNPDVLARRAEEAMA